MTSFALFCCVIALPIIVLGNKQEWKDSAEPIYSPNIATSSVVNGKKGWIGCHFNSEVCEPDEACVDDHLFGVCRSVEESPNSALFFHDYKDLSKDWKRVLEAELSRLADEGYGWTDVYAQCVLRATLLASRSTGSRDLSLCQELAKASLTDESDQAPPPPPPRALKGNEISVSNRRLAALLEAAEAEKRDAAVRLHKYFDQRMAGDREPIEVEQQEGGAGEQPEEDFDLDEEDVEDIRSRLRQLQLDALREEARRSLNSDRVADLAADFGSDDTKAAPKQPTAKEQVVPEEKRSQPMGQAHAQSKAENMSPEQALSKVRPAKRLDGRHKAVDFSEAAAHRASDEAEAEPEAEALLYTMAPERVNFRWIFLEVGDAKGKPKQFRSKGEVESLLDNLQVKLGLKKLYDTFEFKGNEIDFHLPDKWKGKPQEVFDLLKNITELPEGLRLLRTGLGRASDKVGASTLAPHPPHFLLTFVVCGGVLVMIVAVIVVFFMQRYRFSKDKLYNLTKAAEQGESTEAYQDLCRHRMQARSSEKPEPAPNAARAVAGAALARVDSNSAGSARSSTSSWSEEPVHTNMDISTGHLILSYMEEHLNNKEKLEQEWNNLCAYQPDSIKAEFGKREANLSKNRYLDIIPYDGNRVPLKTKDTDGEDYINASYVINHDPKNPQYIVTQGPLANTVSHFWQLVWEQGSIVIVNLTRLVEDGSALCHKYWPEEGSELYNNYEVHLVSEHVWCEDYLVRSFYLKNVATGETRTVTQFHFLTWADLKEPSSVKALLDFRRKVNKSYKGRSCPIVIHCSDGCGRSGTYILLDMLLTRLAKGVKEMDISAAVEHLRDQRCEMVKTRAQFEFVLMAIAEEVHAMLKTLPQ